MLNRTAVKVVELNNPNQPSNLENEPTFLTQKLQAKTRKTLDDIKHVPEPEELYEQIMSSLGWPYKTVDNRQKFLTRDRALAAILYLGDFRAIEVLPITEANFEDKQKYIWIKDVVVGKTRHGKIRYREAKLPLAGPRKPFTDLIIEYLKIIEPNERLFPWSLKKVRVPLKSNYKLKDGTEKIRYSVTMVGTKRAWQIVNALLPNYTQHWLRAFGYNFDYDNMDHDIMAVSDKTKADPRSLQPYLRRRYEKYPVR
jgi:hypothetical protein